jgi:hypothetical protein
VEVEELRSEAGQGKSKKPYMKNKLKGKGLGCRSSGRVQPEYCTKIFFKVNMIQEV